MKKRSSKGKKSSRGGGQRKKNKGKVAHAKDGTTGSWVDRVVFESLHVDEEGGSEAADNDASSSSSSSSSALIQESEAEEAAMHVELSSDDTPTVPTRTRSAAPSSTSTSLSVVSWNILAESYCSRKSHPHLPERYQSVVFYKTKRRQRMLRLLHHFAVRLETDVLCLQEVDSKEIAKWMRGHGYRVVETPRGVDKADGCAICVQEGGGAGAPWRVVDEELIRLDDVATYQHQTTTENNGTTSHPTENASSSPSSSSSPPPHQTGGEVAPAAPVYVRKASTSNLQGFQQSFLRRNVALMIRIQHVVTKRTVVIVNAHLYWNPEYEYVKLCQTHYICLRAHAFCRRRGDADEEPIVFCGDLNSRPGGSVHSYLSKGFINAKLNAPWYCLRQQRQLVQVLNGDKKNGNTSNVVDLSSNGGPDTEDDGAAEDVGIEQMSRLRLDERDDQRDSHLGRSMNSVESTKNGTSSCRVRYLLDATLNKFCRWLRILGIDTALETEEEERLRTSSEQKMILFERCRSEGRALVTTSTRLLLRSDCPPGTYCINPSSLPHLEVALVHLLRAHGAVLEPSKFLSRCVVCNGNIVSVGDAPEKRRILREYQCPGDLAETMNVYACDGCGQGYWWCPKPQSSASRVKNQATKLFELCLRAGVPYVGSLGMFDFVNVKQYEDEGWDYSLPGSELLRQNLHVVEWLKDEHLRCPFQLQSAYAKFGSKDDHDAASKDLDETAVLNVVGELLPFTNVTHGFKDTLDYVFFGNRHLVQTERLHVPTTFEELSGAGGEGVNGMENSHLLPSDVWPSDHLAVGARFRLAVVVEPAEDEATVSVAKQDLATKAAGDQAVAYTTSLFCLPLNNGQSTTTTPPPHVLHWLKSNKPPSVPRVVHHWNKPNKPPPSSHVVPLNKPNEPRPMPRRAVHGKRCDCGCVPPTAELRKQARLRKQQAARS